VKNSIALISMLTVLILCLLMVPIVIPINAVSANVADNVTLNNIQSGPCGTWGIPAYVKSEGSFTCNMTVFSDTVGTNSVDVLYELSGGGLSSPWSVKALNAISYTGPGERQALIAFVVPPVVHVPVGTYNIRVGASPNATENWTYSATRASGFIINNTAPTAPSLATPLANACSNTQRPTFTWNAVDNATTYTLMIDMADNMTCISSTSYTMTEYMTQATHTWAIKAIDRAGNTSIASENRTLCIDATDPSDPTLLTPANGSTVAGGYNPTYTWTRSTDTSTCANIQYIVETYSNSGLGAAYLVDNATVAQPVAGDPSYSPGTPLSSSATGEYWWRVRAYDCAGRTSSWATVFKFTKPVMVTTVSITLSTGWNLISLPLTPTSDNISDVINPVKTSVASVFYLDSTVGWQWYEPNKNPQGSHPVLTTMEGGKSYWINVVPSVSSCTLTISGTPCPVVSAGGYPPELPEYEYTTNSFDNWNMLGFKCTQNMLVGTADTTGYLSSLYGRYSRLLRYSAGWVTVTSSDNMTPGTGYFIQMTQTGYVVPPCY